MEISFLLSGYILAQDRADDGGSAVISLSVRKMISVFLINKIHFRGFSGGIRVGR